MAWRARAGVGLLGDRVGKHTAKTWPFDVLDEYIAMVRVRADRREDDRQGQASEMPARWQARRVVVHAAHGEVAPEVNTPPNGFFQAERVAGDLRVIDAFSLEILR